MHFVFYAITYIRTNQLSSGLPDLLTHYFFGVLSADTGEIQQRCMMVERHSSFFPNIHERKKFIELPLQSIDLNINNLKEATRLARSC
jgi:hypothetical protein